MAKKTETKNALERVYNVPLRKETMKAPNWKRTPKAVKALRAFIARHMKSDHIVIGKYANQLLWKDGIKNPPHHIKVNAVKDEKGKVMVELVELPGKAKRDEAKLKELEKKAKEKEAKKEAAKPAEKKGEKEAKEAQFEEIVEETKKEHTEEAKKIEKEEIKELKEQSKKHYHHPVPSQKQPKEQHIHPQQPTAPKSQ